METGKAIMGVMGGKVAAIDVDPRNGANVDHIRQMFAALSIRVFAEVETPSGGRHFYVAGHPELASAHNLIGWPGIDVQSFGALVFLHGTDDPSTTVLGTRSSLTTSTHLQTVVIPKAHHLPVGLLIIGARVSNSLSLSLHRGTVDHQTRGMLPIWTR